MKNIPERYIPLLSLTSTLAGILAVFIFDIINANVILLTVLVYFTFLGGYLSGAISGFVTIIYTLYRFMEPQQPFVYTAENIKSIAVTMIFVPLMIYIVGYLKKDLISKNMELERANEVLRKLSVTDSLTSIHNRRYFDEVFSDEFKRASRFNIPIAMAIIDIDYFKEYNDIYGHIAGDNSLRSVAQRIQNQVQRTGDFAARYGGDEFAVVLPNTNLEGASVVCGRILEAVRDLKIPHNASDMGMLTISIGIAVCSDFENLRSEDLINMADRALYKSKAKGRNQYSF